MAVRSPTVDELLERMRRERAVPRLVDVCLREDLDTAGDVTTRSLVEPGRRAVASMVVRERGVIAGLDLCREDPRLDLVRPDVADGARVDAGTRIAVVEGPLAHVLILERTILNLVGWLSGIVSAGFLAYVISVLGLWGGLSLLCYARVASKSHAHSYYGVERLKVESLTDIKQQELANDYALKRAALDAYLKHLEGKDHE